MGMRDVFGQVLGELMAIDDKIVVIDADLAGCDGTKNLRKQFPDRALDVGIAEANMASIAGGMSAYGYKPWITSFTPFATRRICDQLSISLAYSKQNVKVVGTDPGISAELNGGTHMSVEDVGVVRSIPGVVIFEPIDEVMLRKAVPVLNDYKGVVYMRMFRKDQPIITKEDYKFDLFKADVLKEGKDVTIFATGIMVDTALKAAEALQADGINAEVINVHTIKPVDEKTVLASLARTGAGVVAENHNVLGGLYSAICEVVCRTAPAPILPIGIPDRFGEVGKMPYLREQMGMTLEDLIAACKKAVNMK